jgi:hypothetical protein
MKSFRKKFNDRFEREVGTVAVLNQSRRLLAFSCLLMLCSSGGMAQTASNPHRWQAQYTQIYSDNIETVTPALGPGFILDAAGSLTSVPSEVISGSTSIKGFYSGSGSFTPYLQTDPTIVPLSPNHPYQVTFQYKILTSPSNGFQVLFYSPTGGALGDFLPAVTITGTAGSSGTATLTNTLGSYSDYEIFWTIVGTGAIAIDNIQITMLPTGQAVVSENAEGTAPNTGSGLQVLNGATVTTSPALVIGGKASILLSSGGTIVTLPTSVPLAPNSTYIVEFDYRIVTLGQGDTSVYLSFSPPGPFNAQQSITLFGLPKNASSSGHFSTGALTNAAASYVLNIVAAPGWSLVIDNVSINRQSSVPSSTLPASWSALSHRPFPRLGNSQQLTPEVLATSPSAEPAFTYSVNQIESRLAFADVIAGLTVNMQSESPDSISRIRQLNPNAASFPIGFQRNRRPTSECRFTVTSIRITRF